jgi:hypothetical protein
MNDHGIGASFFDGSHGKNKELKGFLKADNNWIQIL